MNTQDLIAGASAIARGGVVAYPTEACFGIGCDPMNPIALERIEKIKRRPCGKGFIVIAARIEHLLAYLSIDDASILDAPRVSWPGPYTWIFPANPKIHRFRFVADGTIAVRVTAHPVAARLCALFGGAIVSTSANRHGQVPLRKYIDVERLLGSGLDFVVRGPLGGNARPTEIRNAVTGRLIRAA